MYERPHDDDYIFPTVANDELYLSTVVTLASGKDSLPNEVRETVLAIERQSEQSVEEAPGSNVSGVALRHLVVISAIRQFGLLSEPPTGLES